MLPGGDDHRGSHRYDLLKARFRQLETNHSKVSQSNATDFNQFHLTKHTDHPCVWVTIHRLSLTE